MERSGSLRRAAAGGILLMAACGGCASDGGGAAGRPASRGGAAAGAEPDAEAACRWWTDLRHIVTPIGWKDHPFRFNVLFNGTILAEPHLNRRTEAWKGEGVQLMFVTGAEEVFPRLNFGTRDDGRVRQGWNDGPSASLRASPAPVLWSEWPQDGLLLRQDVFAHVPGGGDAAAGPEPLFAWIRLSVRDACRELPLASEQAFAVKLNAPHLTANMSAEDNLTFHRDRSAYPRPLVPDADGAVPARGWRLLERDGRVRLGIAAGRPCTVRFLAGKPRSEDHLLSLAVASAEGSHVDLLLPIVPADRAVFDRELALGFEGALAEARDDWSKVPATAARVDTPEPLVNDTIRHSLKFAEVIAERNPADGTLSMLSGSFRYAQGLWATPHAMACVMLLDALGYHDAVDRHVEVFRREQGTVAPPAEGIGRHPGYLSTPRSLTAIDWLSDHGAILYTVSSHALLSGDARFTERWTDAVVKACEFIRDARASNAHGGVKGIMPPAVATDRGTRIQAVWNDGWNYKGLTTAVRLLKRIGHPRAAEFEAEARDYRERFVRALREKAARMPRWKDARGREHPLVPTALSGDTDEETRHPFYLDTGPLFLVFAGLLDADDPLMRSTLAWFREGPQTRFYRPNSVWWLTPCLDHEMSSCEPCYSWNVFHSHASGDRTRFLEGMYSLFAGSVSRQTFISCEHRGATTGTIFSAPLAIYLARLAAVDDQVRDGELHLLRLAPLAWMRADRETAFENMPTEFGPVTLRARLADGGGTLAVAFEPRFREAPRRVVLHVPPVEGLTRVTLNGKPLAWDGRQATLDIVE